MGKSGTWWLNGFLVVIFLIVTSFVVWVMVQQSQLVNDIRRDYANDPNGPDNIVKVMGSMDKTVTTVVGFATAVATGILGYLGGSAGKQEAKDEAKAARQEATEAKVEMARIQGTTGQTPPGG
jgi:hypothetical protein